jgi:SAM-dependent methyltransferase
VNDLDPTGRFADRVDAYRRARPGYPAALFDHLDRRLAGFGGLEVGGLEGLRVADLGSGTGILTAELLARGCRVWAVEPNAPMRLAAEQELGGSEAFTSVAGTAEDTGLEAGSVELATAGQAFHWFDLEKTRHELERILAPGGRVAVVWNNRRVSGAFLAEYEDFLLEWAIDYRAVRAKYGVERELDGFFAPGALETVVFDNHQDLDLEGFRSRLVSSSYLPGPGHERSAAMLEAAERLFEAHQREGVVRLEYDCVLHLGGF